MALRSGHGTGKGVPRIEVLPADELPTGVAAPEPDREALPRPPYAKGSAAAREAGRRGGRRKASTTKLANQAGLSKVFSDASFQCYRSAAENFAKLHVGKLAQSVGGGECGPGPSSIVWSAGLQLAASRYAFEVLGDLALGSKLANDSRQNLLAAHELCAREAKARADRDDTLPPWFIASPQESSARTPKAPSTTPSTPEPKNASDGDSGPARRGER